MAFINLAPASTLFTHTAVLGFREGIRGLVGAGKRSPHGTGSLFVSPHGSLVKLKAYIILSTKRTLRDTKQGRGQQQHKQ